MKKYLPLIALLFLMVLVVRSAVYQNVFVTQPNPVTNAYTFGVFTVSNTVGGTDDYLRWMAASNGVLAFPMEVFGENNIPGINFIPTNPPGTVWAQISAVANHDGAYGTPELIILSYGNIAIIPGAPIQSTLATVYGKATQFGRGSPTHDSFYVQADTDPTDTNYADNVTSYPQGHSKPMYLSTLTTTIPKSQASTLTNNINASVGIFAISGGTNLLSTGLAPGMLRFYSDPPTANSPVFDHGGSWWINMETNGVNLRGKLIQENQNALITSNTYALDFNRAAFMSLQAAVTNVTLTTTNEVGTNTSAEVRTFVLRSGAISNNFTFPAGWNVLGVSAGGSIGTGLGLNQQLVLEITSYGLGETNKNVKAYFATDNGYAIDFDTKQFMSAIGSSSGVLTNAINYLVTALKADIFWTNCDVIYPFVGGTSNAHAINLRNTNSEHIVWSGNLAGAAAHTTNGIKGDGSTGFGNTLTNLNAYTNAAYTKDSAHVFAYVFSAPTVFISEFAGSAPAQGTDLTAQNANLYRVTDINDNGGGLCDIAPSPFKGPLLATRTSSTSLSSYLNAQTATISQNSVAIPAAPLFILARGPPTIDRFSDAGLAGFSIGGSMTSDQWNRYRTIWNNFNAMLGRQQP